VQNKLRVPSSSFPLFGHHIGIWSSYPTLSIHGMAGGVDGQGQ
jgi:hypothetical protein